jgi:hypothetical protein
MNDKKDVEIRVFGSLKAYGTLDMEDESRVAEVIRNRVLPQLEADYFRIDVKIRRKPDHTPDYLIAYCLRKDIYLAEVVKVAVDNQYADTAIEFNYDDSEEKDEDEEEGRPMGGTCVVPVEFVAATPVPTIPTARAAVETLYLEAGKAGLGAKMLLGDQATIANYKRCLTAGLKAFVSIGHGSPTGIVLWDGPLTATWFAGMPTIALKPEVIYFNSCQVFNDPLKPAMMKAGARTFIGGIVNLLIGPSEEVCKCFWNWVAWTSTKPMGSALVDCEKEHYPKQGAHGIAGDTGRF